MREGDKVVYMWKGELRTGKIYHANPSQTAVDLVMVERDWALSREHQERMIDLVSVDAIVKHVEPGAFIAIRRMFDKGLE